MATSPFRFIRDYRALPFPEERLRRLARRLVRGERLRPSRLVMVILCSDYRIRKLNRDYRGRVRVTDVLAFPFDDRDLLGEIYISLQRVAAQARRYGLSYEQELERLLVHGLLHLRGFDHRTNAQRKLMESRERRYCSLGAA
jgi:probable rRNA maturation factor